MAEINGETEDPYIQCDVAVTCFAIFQNFELSREEICKLKIALHNAV